jgi:hypothetical protein
MYPSTLRPILRSTLTGTAALLPLLATLPAMALQDAAPAAAPAAAEKALPSFDEIWARSIEAMGGEAAVATANEVTMTGAMQMPAMGLSGGMTTRIAPPDFTLSVVELPGIGSIRSGSAGGVGWSIDPMRGPSLTEAKELAQQRALSQLSSGTLKPSESFSSIEVVGERDFGGTPCYEVRMSSDDLSITSFYSVASGLPTGMRMTMESPMGAIPMEIFFGEWKTFGEVLLPTRTRTRVMGQEQVVAIEKVDFAPIDRAVFALPAEIAALVAAQRPAAAEDAPADGAATKPATTSSPNLPSRRPRPQPPVDTAPGSTTP